MNIYNENNPPTGGTARRIFVALKRAGHRIIDLHYNPNCWGAPKESGWGSWVVETDWHTAIDNFFFVLVEGNDIFLQQPHAPYAAFPIPLTEAEIKKRAFVSEKVGMVK